jgi:aspartokinase
MSSSSIVEKYISEHLSVHDCLKKGIINYSALARVIADEEKIKKENTLESIAISALRLKEKIKNDDFDQKLKKMFDKTNVEVKGSMASVTVEKQFFPESLIEVEKEIKKQHGVFFAIEGISAITLIFQRQFLPILEQKFKKYIVHKKDNLSLITFISPGIQDTPGAVAFISMLFFQNKVNIQEFMSCYETTIVLIESKDLDKVIKFINF